jgi:predicted dehydrogenase
MPSTHRRDFLKTSSVVGSTLALSALHYQRVFGANERLRVASIGCGGKGWSDLNSVAASPAVDVVALCNVDTSEHHLGRAAEKYSTAKTYEDWRKLLDESKTFDAAIVSTPDFMHAPIALPTMELGKHIYCQKPLTHTLFEARQMQLAARRFQVVTQMGNQIHSHTAYRTATHWVHQGKIGLAKEVHSWQAGAPSWRVASDRPVGADPIPSTVRWELWQGVAGERPFKVGMYHPFNWRHWRDYGTGQIGDFGCHIFDPVFTSLKLTSPNSVWAIAPTLHPEIWTDSSTVRYIFPKTEFTQGSLSVTWYDAVGIRPPRDLFQDIPAGYDLPNAGSVIIGTSGSIVIPHVGQPKLFPEDKFPADTLETKEGLDHYVQWADAARGAGKTTDDFDYAVPLTETVLLGTIAIQFPGQTLSWDSKAMAFRNSEKAQAALSKPYRKGWEPKWLAT